MGHIAALHSQYLGEEFSKQSGNNIQMEHPLNQSENSMMTVWQNSSVKYRWSVNMSVELFCPVIFKLEDNLLVQFNIIWTPKPITILTMIYCTVQSTSITHLVCQYFTTISEIFCCIVQNHFYPFLLVDSSDSFCQFVTGKDTLGMDGYYLASIGSWSYSFQSR